MDLSVIAEASHQIIKIAHNPVEEFVHQLRLNHFRDVGDNAFPGTGHPAGFGVGAPAARENEHACVRLPQGLQIGRKLALGKRMAQSLLVLLKGPIRGVFVHVSPMEAGAAVRRIPKVVNGEAFLAKAFNHFGVVFVSPAGGNVDHGR